MISRIYKTILIVLFLTGCAIAIAQGNQYSENKEIAKFKNEFPQNIVDALNHYKAEHGYYPLSLDSLNLGKLPYMYWGNPNDVVRGPEDCVIKRDEAIAKIANRNALCKSDYEKANPDASSSTVDAEFIQNCHREFPPDFDAVLKQADYFTCIIGYNNFKIGRDSTQHDGNVVFYYSRDKSWKIFNKVKSLL